MDIIDKLKKYFNDRLEFIDDKEYDELVYNLGSSIVNREKISDYVLNNILSVEEDYKVFSLMKEVYYFDIRLNKLYNWILNLMFKKEFYGYSMCYKFD